MFASIIKLCPKYVIKEIAGKKWLLFDKIEMTSKMDLQVMGYQYDREEDISMDIQKKSGDVLKIKKEMQT